MLLLFIYLFIKKVLIMFHYGTFNFVRFGRNSSQWARACLFTRFLNHTQRHTTVGKTALDEWLARRRDLT
jgi:hypothetical protein